MTSPTMTVGRAAAATLLLAGAACTRAERPAPPPAGSPLPARAVAVAPVARLHAAARTVPAVVLARDRATLVARVPGSVVALPYEEGDAVAAGAVVARIEAAALRSALAAAEAERTAAEADAARLQALLERGAATPREAENGRTRAAAARAAADGARDALAYAELRAPFSGRVTARPSRVGDVVMPGTALLEIAGGRGLEVEATVEASAAARLAPGTRVEALIDGQAGPTPAVLRAVSPAGDASTHRVFVRADLPPGTAVRPGTFARLRLPAAEDEGAGVRLAVPLSAVVRRGGLGGVFVVEGSRARLRWVALGAADGAAVEVRAGLEDGERVVLDPGDLADGAAVQPR